MNEDDVLDLVLIGLNEENWKEIRDAGIDHIYPSGMTALGMAVDYSKEESACFLLKKGADPNVFGNGMMSPLMDAYVSSEPRLALILLMYGANPKLKEKDKGGGHFTVFKFLEDDGAADFLDIFFTDYTLKDKSKRT